MIPISRLTFCMLSWLTVAGMEDCYAERGWMWYGDVPA